MITEKITQHTLNEMVEALGPAEEYDLTESKDHVVRGFIEVEEGGQRIEVPKRIAYTAEVNRVNDKVEWVILKMQVLED